MIDFRIGKYGCLVSTNQFLRNETEIEKSVEGLVIQAEKQTGGRGYGDNSWESDDGMNLLFSFHLKPDFLAAGQQFYLSMIVSLTLVNILKQLSSRDGFSIKWPNDIYFGQKKIAGILVENSIQGAVISDSIIGVGLNINQKNFSDNLPNPVSLIQITGKTTDRDEMLADFLKVFAEYYQNLKNGKLPIIKKRYLNNFFLKDVESEFIIDNQRFNGVIDGVDEFGRLEVVIDGHREKFGFKEIEFIIK